MCSSTLVDFECPIEKLEREDAREEQYSGYIVGIVGLVLSTKSRAEVPQGSTNFINLFAF